VGALVEINCETDFVTKNDSFLAFTKAAAEGIVKNNPADVAARGRHALQRWTASARRWKTCARA
jgi:translation elongation factor EF-Ts